jgi:hypothetical protein
MTWRKWDFEVGQDYALSDVIGTCDARIREGSVIRDKSKNEMVRRIEKYSPAKIVWSPSKGAGLGRFPIEQKLLALRGREPDFVARSIQVRNANRSHLSATRRQRVTLPI